MKTETDKLTGQEAIDFAKHYGLPLCGWDLSGHHTGGIGGRIISEVEAQQMVDEGIVEGVWCWMCEAFETCEPHEDFDIPAGNIQEDEDGACDPEYDRAYNSNPFRGQGDSII